MRLRLLLPVTAAAAAVACSQKPHVVIFNETGTDIAVQINSTPQAAEWTDATIIVKRGTSRRMEAIEALKELDPLYSKLRLRVGGCEYSYRVPDGYRPGEAPDDPLLLQIESDLLIYRATDPWKRTSRARLLQVQRDGYPLRASERNCADSSRSN